MTKKRQAQAKVVLITGAARRIGAAMAAIFHDAGYRVIVHYRHSEKSAETLVKKLNQKRKNSAVGIFADLDNPLYYDKLIQESYAVWKKLDVLIHNASTFFPTPLHHIIKQDWDNLLNSNLKAPLFLSQAASPFLKKHQGNIIMVTDVHADVPMKNYTVYSCAKAGLSMLMKSLAVELAPDIRVNAIAPGNVIWPEGQNHYSDKKKKQLLSASLLQRKVDKNDIAKAALFLAENNSMTGETIAVDAGKRK